MSDKVTTKALNTTGADVDVMRDSLGNTFVWDGQAMHWDCIDGPHKGQIVLYPKLAGDAPSPPKEPQ